MIIVQHVFLLPPIYSWNGFTQASIWWRAVWTQMREYNGPIPDARSEWRQLRAIRNNEHRTGESTSTETAGVAHDGHSSGFGNSSGHSRKLLHQMFIEPSTPCRLLIELLILLANIEISRTSLSIGLTTQSSQTGLRNRQRRPCFGPMMSGKIEQLL